MSSYADEDQEQRKTSSMEESDSMTIEFLRARLLSERSVSKSARQRADDLAKRVEELEEQLKFVSLQREKAEKATVDVLAILEDRGISDVSEEFDSYSGQDESPHDFKARNGSLMIKEPSMHTELRKNEVEAAYSSSEIESSPSTGRSLSWRNTKDSQHSIEKKKNMDSIRRRASFTSNSSSARRAGKSCRKIRIRDRSIEELQKDGAEKPTCSSDINSFDGEPVGPRGSSGYANGKNPLESPIFGSNSEPQKVYEHSFSGHERNEDMESALQHQAQLIGRYEEEEKAQREWEEKFRENNSGTQDSCDPGNHSDVTEDRYEVKSPGPSFATGTMNSDNQEMKQQPADVHFSEPQTSKSSSSLSDADKGSLQDGKCNSNTSACEYSALEGSFPMSNENSDQGFSGKQHEASANISSSHVGKNTPLHASSRSSSSSELPIVRQETSKNVASVLDALQLVKLSLNQKLTSSAPVGRGASGNAIKPFNQETNNAHSLRVPVSSPGLFRLPTDYQYEANARANLGIGGRSTFANFLPEIAPARLLSEPFVESRSLLPGDPFLTAPHRPFTPEIRSEIPPQRSLSLSQHTLSQGPSSYRLDHFTSPVVPPVKDSYPFLPDITLHVPLNEERTSRAFPSSESRLPPGTRLSSYDEYARPNMYNR